MRSKVIIVLVLLLVLAGFQNSFGAVSAEEAAQLKTVLTPTGAEKAGNKEGTIPAWDGGYTKVPDGYKSGEVRPDPFADEKPLYSITAQNVANYADKLSEGAKEMFKKFPQTFRIDVYPTHRTYAAPQFVYDNTLKNATKATTKNNGWSLENAHGGFPFPIPKTGAEVMWNFLCMYRGQATLMQLKDYIVAVGSKPVVTSSNTELDKFWYFIGDKPTGPEGMHHAGFNTQLYPPYMTGQLTLLQEPVDNYTTTRGVWQYLAGQRRIRRCPSFVFDTPSFVTSGMTNWDETFLFNGSLERYDWKLLGKKEVLVPYNCNKFWMQKEIPLGQNHLNPDYVRWELHRVWVVEANLLPGKRHVVPKRRFYIDEDSWCGLLSDGWDAQGVMWRHMQSIPLLVFDGPFILNTPFTANNFLKGGYVTAYFLDPGAPGMQCKLLDKDLPPDSAFAPEALVSQGVR